MRFVKLSFLTLASIVFLAGCGSQNTAPVSQARPNGVNPYQNPYGSNPSMAGNPYGNGAGGYIDPNYMAGYNNPYANGAYGYYGGGCPSCGGYGYYGGGYGGGFGFYMSAAQQQ